MCGTAANVLRLSVIVLYSLAQTTVTLARLQSVEWTLDGVKKEEYQVTVKPGDMLTLMCPKNSYSTIWFIENQDQYDNCNCETNCIYASSCLYFDASNYTTTIKSTSESLQNTPDYRPGQTYYFASFAEDFSTLGDPRASRSGGECLEMLKIAVQVLADNKTEDTDVSNGDDGQDTTYSDYGSGEDRYPTDDDINYDYYAVDALSSTTSLYTSSTITLTLSSMTILYNMVNMHFPVHPR